MHLAIWYAGASLTATGGTSASASWANAIFLPFYCLPSTILAERTALERYKFKLTTGLLIAMQPHSAAAYRSVIRHYRRELDGSHLERGEKYVYCRRGGREIAGCAKYMRLS